MKRYEDKFKVAGYILMKFLWKLLILYNVFHSSALPAESFSAEIFIIYSLIGVSINGAATTPEAYKGLRQASAKIREKILLF